MYLRGGVYVCGVLYASAQPLVSVVIVTYNSSKFIVPCIQSVLNSDYPRVETIVVDNDSQDGTADIIHEQFETVVLIKSGTNLRYAAGNNLGIKNSRGELVFLLNPDATIRKDCINSIVNSWLEDPTIGIIGCKIYYERSDLLQSAGGLIAGSGDTRRLGDKRLDSGEFDQVRDVQWTSGAAMMVSRQALKRIGMFDPIYYFFYEETDLCWRAQKGGMRVIYLPTAVAFHFEGHVIERDSLLRRKYIQASRVVFVLKNYKRNRLLVWMAAETVSFLSNLARVVVASPKWKGVWRRRLRNSMFAYSYSFKVLPQILSGRLGNQKLGKESMQKQSV
jgi:hypothetical protein